MHGLIGVNGQGVLSLVEEDPKKDGELKPHQPNMVETDVQAVTLQDNPAIMETVQVKYTKPVL